MDGRPALWEGRGPKPLVSKNLRPQRQEKRTIKRHLQKSRCLACETSQHCISIGRGRARFCGHRELSIMAPHGYPMTWPAPPWGTPFSWPPAFLRSPHHARRGLARREDGTLKCIHPLSYLSVDDRA